MVRGSVAVEGNVREGVVSPKEHGLRRLNEDPAQPLPPQWKPSFDDLVRAHGARWEAKDYQTAHAWDARLNELQERFERVHGEIKHRYFSSSTEAAVVVAGSGYLHAVSPLMHSAGTVELFFRAQRANEEARSLTKGDDLLASSALLFTVLSTLLRMIDKTGTQPDAAVLRLMQKQVSDVEQSIERVARRRAELTYNAGVVAGTGGIFVISLLTDLIIPHLIGHLVPTGDGPRVAEFFAACLNAGGAGALLSVMMRMSGGTLAIRYRAGMLTLFIVGAFRPVIGGISGVAVYTLYQAKLIPLAPPPGTSDFFLFGGLAFLSGFSERLAQDTLVQTGRKALQQKLDTESDEQARNGAPNS